MTQEPGAINAAATTQALMADRPVPNGTVGPFTVSNQATGDLTATLLVLNHAQPPGRYYHPDQIGSVRAVTNEYAEVTATRTYDPYGRPTTATTTSDFGYAGQYTDAETGLQYLRARYYDPSTGQFLNRDPMVSSTRDVYGYASRSPLTLADPSGLYSADTADHYVNAGYSMVNSSWCEGGFGFAPPPVQVNDSNWRHVDPAAGAAYAYVHLDDLKREGQLPDTTGDRLAPSIWQTVVPGVCNAASVVSVLSIPGAIAGAGNQAGSWWLSKVGNGFRGSAEVTSKTLGWVTVVGTGVDLGCRIAGQ
jgi:RHS repeat-associated protein